MNEEQEEKLEYPDIPDWLDEWIDRRFIDSTGEVRYDDLPEEFSDWHNHFHLWGFVSIFRYGSAKSGEIEITSLDDCDLLANHVMPRYKARLNKALFTLWGDIWNEYRAIKKRPCTICGNKPIGNRHLDICDECKEKYASEVQRVRIQLYRARKAKTEATLTIVEWLAILERFNHRCAYCETGAYETFEHYVPISKGGGTTKENCVPSCKSCNASKGNKHPEREQIEPSDHR